VIAIGSQKKEFRSSGVTGVAGVAGVAEEIHGPQWPIKHSLG
jgi:hypothetical protein